ncbi:hypothetical protein [Exiguobacterium sp. 22311]|uniref:hypothetical protein n=1 Tax=Exiguobacterium sp. 22311 TaxID=3453907 RepID=UPI003F82ABCC
MEGQSISIQQMKDVAKNLEKRECKLLYISDLDQLVIIVREDNNKVFELKNVEKPALSFTYSDAVHAFVIEIHFSLNDLNNDDKKILIPLPVTPESKNYLEKVAHSSNSIQITVVDNDIDKISSRHYFNNVLLKDVVARELKKIRRDQ